MESCAFTYDGNTNLSCTVTGATPGVTYRMSSTDGNSANADVLAVTSTVVINSTDIGASPGFTFRTRVRRQDNKTYVGADGFEFGVAGELPTDTIWSTDGANPPSVTVTIPNSVLGKNYRMDVLGAVAGSSVSTFNTGVGTGGDLVITTVGTAAMTFGYFGQVSSDDSPYEDIANRLFVSGVAGRGSPGNPLVAGSAEVIVTLDGVDVTQYCVAGNWTRRLNRPSTAQVRCPMELVSADVGTLLKIEALVAGDWKIVHHGRVLLCETDTAEDGGYTVYNSTDPMEMWQWRPVRDNDCDFTAPQIISEYTTGAETIEAALRNSVDCGDSSQADCEGDLFLTINAAASGGVDLTGAPTDWPMTIAELTSLFVSTGTVDVVITPTDPGGGIMGDVDFYNGDYGQDLSATIVFSYGMNAHNVRRLRWNQDMTSMVNKLWYYAGPRLHPAFDPAGDQHWCFNVTGSDGGAAHVPPYTGGLAYPPGGDLSPPASATNNQLGVLRASSEAAYGVRMDIQIFDAEDDDCILGVGTPGHELYRYRWQQEAWLRAQPREIIHITPTRETEIGTFDIGDLVGVEAVSAVRGGFTGAQRVYEYTVSWDQDGVLELSELQTSADNEGF